MMTQENIPYTADEIKAMVKTCEKYNKALEKALKLRVQNPFDTVGQMIEHIFPELEENEDEKIRKAILELVKQSSEILGTKNQNNMIAWIEKQGQTFTKKDVDDAYLQGICDAKHEIEKQGKTLNARENIPIYGNYVMIDRFKEDFGL